MKALVGAVLTVVSFAAVSCTSTSGIRDPKPTPELENSYFGEVDSIDDGGEWLTTGDVGPLPLN